MSKIQLSVYEIEHEGDEDDAITELKAAGCRGLRVIERAYQTTDGSDESMRVELELPEGMTIEELHNKCENTCF